MAMATETSAVRSVSCPAASSRARGRGPGVGAERVVHRPEVERLAQLAQALDRFERRVDRPDEGHDDDDDRQHEEQRDPDAQAPGCGSVASVRGWGPSRRHLFGVKACVSLRLWLEGLAGQIG